MIRRPSLLYVWLPLGLAAYCFATLLEDAREGDWRETPATALTAVGTGGRVVTRDVLGRPRTRWTEGHSVLRYRYTVESRPHKGYWNGSVPPVEPATVLYDPDRPERSTLKTRPAGAAFHVVGWGGLVLGLAAFALRRRPRDAPAPASSSEQAAEPRQRARTVFRLLVLAELAILLARQGFHFATYRVPMDVYDQIDQHLQPGPLREMAADLYPVAILLSVIASLGLLTFWRPARQLLLLTWCWSLAVSWFADASIDYGFDAFLRLLGRLLGGAIIALSFYGPLATAFKTREPPADETTGRPRRAARTRS